MVSLSTEGDADPLGRTGAPGVMAPGFVSVEEPEPPGHIRTTKVCPPSKEKNAPCKGGPTLAAGYSRSTSDCPSQGGATDLRQPHQPSMAAQHPGGEGSSRELITGRRPEHTSMDCFKGFRAHMEDERLRAVMRISELRQALRAREAAYFEGNLKGRTEPAFHNLKARDTSSLSNAERVYVGLNTALESAGIWAGGPLTTSSDLSNSSGGASPLRSLPPGWHPSTSRGEPSPPGPGRPGSSPTQAPWSRARTLTPRTQPLWAHGTAAGAQGGRLLHQDYSTRPHPLLATAPGQAGQPYLEQGWRTQALSSSQTVFQ